MLKRRRTHRPAILKMIKYMNNTNPGNGKSNQFSNDQIIHHISVSSQSQPSIGYQNFHLNHGLTAQLNSTNLLTNLSLATRSSNQLASQTTQSKHQNKIKTETEKENKSYLDDVAEVT